MTEEKQSFEEIIEKDGRLVYTCRGFSMYPMLRQKRDLIIIEKKPEGRLKNHDVVLFKRNGMYILHRIITVKEDGYDTAGDHNWWKEHDVKEEEIIGVLAAFVRDGKEITPDNPLYQTYVHLWCDLYPVRMGLLKTRAGIGKLIRHVRKG